MQEIKRLTLEIVDQEALELDRIIEIAQKVREEFENGDIDDEVLGVLYQEYNSSIGDIDLFIQRSKELFPSLNCGLASVYLRDKIKTGRVINGSYQEENHTFLLVLTGTSAQEIIVDITSDQYGGPPIYVGPSSEPSRYQPTTSPMKILG